jgi:UDP-glucose 4-epimerase
VRAVVTGGAGFIGSYLVDRLLDDGYFVTVVDNMSRGYLENLKQHSNNSCLTVKEADIRDGDKLNRIFAGHDVAFHMAAHANIRESFADHRVDLNNNVIGTLNVLEAMCKNGIQDLVFGSTSAVYGEATVKPTPEDSSFSQTSLYGASKLACEAYAEAFTQFTPIKLWAFRFGNIIGETRRNGVIWDLVHKLLKNPSELEILGDGRQNKEYLHAEDCVNGIMIGYKKGSSKLNIFNLSSDEQTLVDEIADIVIEEMGLKNVKRNYTGGPRGWVGDIPDVKLSLNKIKKLGWKQKISSEEAIRRAVRWTLEYESHRRINRK